jgi:hypothetical protein
MMRLSLPSPCQVADIVRTQAGPSSASLRLGMARVMRVVLLSARVVRVYMPGGRSLLIQFVSANVGRDQFEACERELGQAMAVGVPGRVAWEGSAQPVLK